MYYAPFNIVITSSGSGNVASAAPSPYNFASNCFNFSGVTLVESMIKEAVGLYPVTLTGVVVASYEKVIASGLSL